MPRRIVTVRGIVQGVGYRPFVHEVACRLGLTGFVRNQGGSAVIEVEGTVWALDGFLAELAERQPPGARIDSVSWLDQAEQGDRQFNIESSAVGGSEAVAIAPDIATCSECLAELFNPGDRRYRYPLLNCTHCGPRLTIITAVPYDRPRTTMAAFAMCPACRREYEDPTNRRFHAQPIACPTCGPWLTLLGADGTPRAAGDPIDAAARALQSGAIVAVKGVGGFHLACDARNESAVSELRRRKHRDARPFAVMVQSLAAGREICEISAFEAELLESPARPIVLVRKRAAGVADGVAPLNPCLGLMLSYTPLHHLLLEAVGGTPLVMTSGNRSDEPIAYEDRDAVERLHGLADFYLAHNRPIHLRCDDSVVRSALGGPLLLRRSRGYAPLPLPLPIPCPVPILAVGGQLKAAFALGRDKQAILSHHLGDLDYLSAYQAYEQAAAHYETLFAIEPALIVHDLHPDYATTRYAESRPLARLAVQHHHAHLAACLAEHSHTEPAIGVIFDGTGLGDDGSVWGGEFLIGDFGGYRRAAHLRYVPMPGGEQAIREPWRMALAHLIDADVNLELRRCEAPPSHVETVRRWISRRRDSNMQATSSAGRLFDAVAALAGVRSRVEYEGQAAMELEYLATDRAEDGDYPFELQQPESAPARPMPLVVDTRPLIAAVAGDVHCGVPAAMIARRFHSTIVEMIVRVCVHLRERTQLETVALSGGVFMNAVLVGEVVPRLESLGFQVLRHQQVPPNDGGLCLGQLVIAAAHCSRDNVPAAAAAGFQVRGQQ